MNRVDRVAAAAAGGDAAPVRRWGSAVVGYAGLGRPQDLVGGLPLEAVFTPAERVRSARGRTLQHWAGRLAGKHAVLRLLAVRPTAARLGQVEVLPRPTPACRADGFQTIQVPALANGAGGVVSVIWQPSTMRKPAGTAVTRKV